MLKYDVNTCRRTHRPEVWNSDLDDFYICIMYVKNFDVLWDLKRWVCNFQFNLYANFSVKYFTIKQKTELRWDELEKKKTEDPSVQAAGKCYE